MSLTMKINTAGTLSIPEPVESQVNAIETRNLHISYGSFLAVKDVNMDIERQKITAMIGPSGCGNRSPRATRVAGRSPLTDF